MKKFISLIILSITLIFIGCGGVDSESSGNDALIKTVSGYVEDDPIPNANINIYDENGNVILTTKTDVNGKFTLSGKFKNNSIYTFECNGQLNDKNITMHSIVKYTGDSIVNINPLTELKYRLVKSGKSIDEAEKLIRDYFLIINGSKLEQNRFDPSSYIALGMNELAKIYGGKLPIDIIEKIKNDILTNADNNTTNYSYRSLVQNKITLSVSNPSLKTGEYVTLNIEGLNKLNDNYKIKWSGIPDTLVENNTSISFTSDYPQDVFVSAMVYKVDGNKSVLVSTASAKVNFYKELVEKNLTIQNTSVDNNITIGDSSIIIPAGAVSENTTIKIKQYETGSDNTIAKFEIYTSSESDKNLTFRYKYNPYIVLDPRNLVVSITDGNDIKLLSIKNIDYNNHIVEFEIPLSNNIGIGRGIFSPEIVRIEMVKKNVPSKRKVYNLITKYKKYIKILINDFVLQHGESYDWISQYLYDDPVGNAKFIKTLMEKDNTTGEYNYNILASVINQMIAYENAEKLQQNFINWDSLTYNYLSTYLCSQQNICLPLMAIKNTKYDEDTMIIESYYTPIRQLMQIIAPWVGAVKATDEQMSLINTVKLGINIALTINETIAASAIGGATGISAAATAAAVGIAGTAIDYAWPSDMAPNTVGNIWSALTTAAQDYVKEGINRASILNTLIISNVVGIGAELVAKYYEKDNIKKGAPIFLALGLNKQWKKLGGENLFSNNEPNSYSINTFIKNFFSDSETDETQNALNYYVLNYADICKPTIGSIISNCSEEYKSYFGKLDPTGILGKVFLNPYYEFNPDVFQPIVYVQSNLSQKERAYLYAMIRFAYGDPQAKNFVKDMLHLSKLATFKIFIQALALKNEDIFEYITLISGNKFLNGIKSDYDISTLDKFLVFLGYTRSLRNDTNSVSTYQFSNYESFEKVMQTAQLKLTDSQKETIHIKKIIMDTYGVGLNYSDTDNLWTIDKSNIVHHMFVADENINDKFVYDSDLNINVLSFDKLFEGKDFSQFDNKLVGFKVTMVVEINGMEKVVSKNFVLTTMSDTEHTIQTDFEGATIKSSVKDAVTGEPIANAQVTLLPGGLTDYTDENGSYTVSGLAAGDYTITISKPGYVPIEAKITLNEDETKIFEASMVIDEEHASEIGGADIVLKDAVNGNIITNGYIKIREGQNNKTGEVIETIENNTSANSIHFDAAPGIYTVEVGANSYKTAFNTVTIVGDMNQTYEFSITPVLAENEVRIVLTWGETPSDLDSHLVRLNSEGNIDYHVYYGNMHPSNADANLDVDDTTSYGPETITINNLDKNKTYKYYVHDFSNRSNHNDTALKDSGAKVTVYYGDQSQTFYVPNEVGNAWKVFEIINGEIIPCTNGCIFGVSGETDSQIGSRDLRNAQDKTLFEKLPKK